MKSYRPIFPERGRAELEEFELPDKVPAGHVLIHTSASAVSAGTERANLLDMPNISCAANSYPKRIGYTNCGIIEAIGEGVNGYKAGDRVTGNFAGNGLYYHAPVSNILKVEHDNITDYEASFGNITVFPMAALRKTELEVGESLLVMGLGILGVFSVIFARAAGAYPIIAADLKPERRKLALELGADYAFDPSEKDFAQKVKSVTRGIGTKCVIEVTGICSALDQALDCTARFGRIALLGCTRVPDTIINYYEKVHKPGVKIIGAHTMARPHFESYPHYWTWQDDQRAVFDLLASGRISFDKVINEIVSPRDTAKVYDRLANDKDFPIGVVFDWKLL